MTDEMREKPIDPKFRETMNALARGIDTVLNDAPGDRRNGFALFCFEFGNFDGGRVNYISNADRADMIAAVKEWLARAEGQRVQRGHA